MSTEDQAPDFPTCDGIPAHLSVDLTVVIKPQTRKINRDDFADGYAERCIGEARAYRDCARLGTAESRHKCSIGDPEIAASRLARKIMLAWMRCTAKCAVRDVRYRLKLDIPTST